MLHWVSMHRPFSMCSNQDAFLFCLSEKQTDKSETRVCSPRERFHLTNAMTSNKRSSVLSSGKNRLVEMDDDDHSKAAIFHCCHTGACRE